MFAPCVPIPKAIRPFAANPDQCHALKRGREGATPYDAGYILSGKRMMNPSRFGIHTFGNVLASIASFSPMSLFDASM